MLFSSSVFIYLFLPITLFGYFVVFRKSRKCQNIFLLFVSLFFYAWGEPKFVLIMLLSIFMNWLFGLLVNKENKKIGKIIVGCTVVFNLAILFVFKYLMFSMEVVTEIFNEFPTVIIAITEAIPIIIPSIVKKARILFDFNPDRARRIFSPINIVIAFSFLRQSLRLLT